MTANVSITTHKANMLKTIATGDSKCSSFTTIVLATGENGAYPPTKSGSIHPLLSWKSAWNWPKKRSISVQYRLKRWKSLKKTEHCRSPVVREVWWIPKSYRKRSIAVHIGKNESLLSNDLRPKNGALPFTFSIKRQYASGKRSIAVHYSALSCVICM